MIYRVDENNSNDQQAQGSANQTNFNRRRFHSQSPTHNLQNRRVANQIQ